MSYFRKNIDAMSGYVPGEQPPQGAKVVKLNTNESPYPPSPAAMKVLRDLDGENLRRYPDAMAGEFRRAAGNVLGVAPEWILPGNGSDDLVMMIARACTGPGRAAAYPVPTFTFYVTQARVQAAEIVEVPFDEDFNLPVDELAEANAAVTFVANPNSPSGTFAPVDRLDELAGRVSGLLAIDEAYVDFSEQDALRLAEKHDNVIILRTLSKGYSLAGLRLGFGVGNPGLLDGLSKAKAIYNVSAAACAVGAAAIEDQAHKIANAEKIKASRTKLTSELADMGFRVWPSQANFLLARPPGGDAGRMHQALKARGILVRYFNEPRLDDKLRITVGTDRQNAALVEGLKQIIGPRPPGPKGVLGPRPKAPGGS